MEEAINISLSQNFREMSAISSLHPPCCLPFHLLLFGIQAEKSLQVQKYCLLTDQKGWKKMLSLSNFQNVVGATAIRAQLLVIAAFNAEPTANCNDPFVTTLNNGIETIVRILMGLGIAIAVIGIIVGGLMRATAWGSEQRIAMSNKAITCAVIGLVIVLLGVTLGNQIPNWFTKTGCQLS